MGGRRRYPAIVKEQAEEVLAFWFGTLGPDGRATSEQRARWFTRSDALDAEIRERFGELVGRAARGELSDWLSSRRGRLAYVLLVDQFSRNMFRGTPGMYATDALALAAAGRAIEAGDDTALAFDERGFLYMPFMHSEQLADQERCVALFEAFRDQQTGDLRAAVEYSLDYAIRHRDIVARFGRFPHRNEILGRASTDEELEFLKQPGSSF